MIQRDRSPLVAGRGSIRSNKTRNIEFDQRICAKKREVIRLFDLNYYYDDKFIIYLPLKDNKLSLLN